MSATTSTTPELEAIVFDNGHVVARAEADTVADLLYAGQVMHDEALPTCQQVGKLQVGFYVDGVLSAMVTGRPQ